MSVARDSSTKEWLVHYKRLVKGRFEIPEGTIRACHVILGAGALGSTKILLRSKERGLDISPTIGTRCSTNGVILPFTFGGTEETNFTNHLTVAPGPSSSAVCDEILDDNIVSDEGVHLSSGSKMYSVGLALAVKNKDVTKKEVETNPVFLGVTAEHTGGKITYHNETDDVSVSYKDVDYEANFTMVNEAVSKFAEKLGGTFLKNLLWSECLGKSVVTVHPLGGCPMAESGQTGVVNHAGQVFEGNSVEVLEGLYVMGGATIPTFMGLNPSLAISYVVERCVRLLAEREGWHINYEFKHIGGNTFIRQRPGICFTENLVGKYSRGQSRYGETSKCEVIITIESNDVRAMLDFDPAHYAGISGTVTCRTLSSSPLTVSKGRFQLLSSGKYNKPNSPSKQMVYKMVLYTEDNEVFSLHGVKHVHNNFFWEISDPQNTAVDFRIYKGPNYSGDVLGTAKLYITVPNFAKQLESLEVKNAQSANEKLDWLSKFGKLIPKMLWHIYGPVRTHGPNFDQGHQPRQRRALKLGGCIPLIYRIRTEDGYQILLTRYEGGSKGPVVLIHGGALSSEMFALDTIETNLLEYIFKEGYDVWLVDWRLSCRLPLDQVYSKYTLDDVAAYDHPAAINKILEITKKKSVQIMAHCIGATSVFASLLSGNLKGKVRNIIVSQVAMNPIISKINYFKKTLPTNKILTAIGIHGVTVETSENAPIYSRILDGLIGMMVNNTLVPSVERCQDPVCHRATLIYGLLWNHKNLSELTHSTLQEIFGYIMTLVTNQIGLGADRKKLVAASGEDIYLPDSDKGLKSALYREHIGRLNLPICFFVGEHNECFSPEATLTTINLLKEAHPEQNYSRYVISDYYHLDCIIGKNAVRDVYPYILDALEQYAKDE